MVSQIINEDLLKITQTNLQKSKRGQLEVSQRIQASNRRQLPFIHFIQEPMVIHGRAAWQPTSCKKFGVQINPRTLIYTDINRPAWFVESLSNSDITVVQTTINNRSTLLVSLYLDITWIKVIPDSLQKVTRYAEDKRLGIIIAADTNCHSSLFGPSTNKRGEQLELFIAKYKLNVENNSHIPTYESRGAETCIDVTLTARLGVSIADWEVNREYNGSDHNSIEYKLKVDKIKVEPQWLWAKADWELFATEMEKCLITETKFVLDQKECDNMVNHFYNTIDKALKVAVPLSLIHI